MRLLTLTPEAELYVTAAVAVYSLSCGPLAGFLHAHCPGGRRIGFLPLYVAVMSLVTAFSAIALDLPSLTGTTWPVLTLSLPVGIAAGAVAKWGGAALKRLARASDRRASRPLWAAHVDTGPLFPASQSTAALRALQLAAPMLVPGGSVRGGAVASRRGVLGLWLLTGTLEEILFRGVLVDLASRLPGAALMVPCLVASVAAFALTHVTLGWREVLDKLPLGAITLVAVLVMRSVAPAIVAHAFFNLRTWQAAAARGAGKAATRGGSIASRMARR